MHQAPKKWLVPSFLLSFIALTLTVLLSLSATAQTYRGGINGTVTDKTGAAIANVSVVAAETSTGSHPQSPSPLPPAPSHSSRIFPSVTTPSPRRSRVSAPSRPIRFASLNGSIYTLPIVTLPLSSSATTLSKSTLREHRRSTPPLLRRTPCSMRRQSPTCP